MGATEEHPVFYKEMLTWFRELGVIKEPANGRSVRKQPMWRNVLVHVQGKSLTSKE